MLEYDTDSIADIAQQLLSRRFEIQLATAARYRIDNSNIVVACRSEKFGMLKQIKKHLYTDSIVAVTSCCSHRDQTCVRLMRADCVDRLEVVTAVRS